MRGLLAGAVVLFGLALVLNVYGYRKVAPPARFAATNADAAMTPDSGTSGVGYDEATQ